MSTASSQSRPPADNVGAYADWKAPAGDGELLIWPASTQLLDQTRENQEKLSSAESPRLLGVPLNEIRRQARHWIGHNDDDRPLIGTGHQIELWHAGVWVKNAVIGAIAGRLGGQAYHFGVDTDSPKHLMLRWPGASIPITDDPNQSSSAAWTGWVSAPSPAQIAEIRRQVEAGSRDWPFRPVLPSVLDGLQRLSLEQPQLPSALCNALHELDWSLGLRHHAMLTSPILSSPPFLLFVAHVLANARQFAGQYNGALADYRREHGMKTTSRPMPDLFVSPTAVEVPFWLDDVAEGKRTRPSVFDTDCGCGTMIKLASGEEFTLDPAEDGWTAAGRLARFLAGTSHRLSPRALTLTMFLRLFTADQFVHGIGGGRYDQVLDKLIASHFTIDPPKFSVATATLLFPTAVGRQRVCVPCVVHEGHQIRHRILGNRKQQLVQKIDALPRRSPERYRAYVEMQTALQNAWSAEPAVARWQERLQSTREQDVREAVEFDRELFYAIQPRERLAEMIDRVNTSF